MSQTEATSDDRHQGIHPVKRATEEKGEMNITELTFRGTGLNEGETVVTVQEGNHPPEPLDPRFDLRNHSPSGFSWGYPGSGPSQLALSILPRACGDAVAQGIYHTFKDENVARWQEEEFTLTGHELRDWLDRKGLPEERLAMPRELSELYASTIRNCEKHASLEEGGVYEDGRVALAYEKLVAARFDLEDALTLASKIQ